MVFDAPLRSGPLYGSFKPLHEHIEELLDVHLLLEHVLWLVVPLLEDVVVALEIYVLLH